MTIHIYPGIEPRVGEKIRTLCGKRIPFIGAIRTVAETDERLCQSCRQLRAAGQSENAGEFLYVVERPRPALKLTKRGWFEEIGALSLSEVGKKYLRAAVNARLNGTTPPVVTGEEFFELESAIGHVVIGGRKCRLRKAEYVMRLEPFEIDARPRQRRRRRKRLSKRKIGGELDRSAEEPLGPP